MGRGVVPGGIHAAFLLLLLGTALPALAAPPGGKPVTLKVALLPYLSNLALYIPIAEGYFAERGIEIETVTSDSGPALLPSLARGDLDVYTSTVGAGLFNMIARGAEARIVADKGHLLRANDPSYTIMVRKELLDSGKVTGVESLRGLKASTQEANASQYYFDQLLRKGGLSVDDFSLVTLRTTLLYEAFRTGAVDLALQGEPWVTRLTREGVVGIWTPPYETPAALQYAVIVYGPSLLGENRMVGERFMAAYLKGVRQYNQGKTERNVALAQKFTGLDAPLLRAVVWPGIRDDGEVDLESVDGFQAWAVARKIQDRVIPRSGYFDASFIASAAAR